MGGAEVTHIVDAARENEIVDRAAATVQPRQQRFARFGHQLELNGSMGLLLDYAARVDRASRDAFENLIALAIDQGCSFVVLAGDIFDGDLRNFETGLFFIDQMRRLGEAGIQAFLILGNHDAENRFAAKLSLSANVHVFDSKRAEAIALSALPVTVHGRSFPQRDVT